MSDDLSFGTPDCSSGNLLVTPFMRDPLTQVLSYLGGRAFSATTGGGGKKTSSSSRETIGGKCEQPDVPNKDKNKSGVVGGGVQDFQIFRGTCKFFLEILNHAIFLEVALQGQGGCVFVSISTMVGGSGGSAKDKDGIEEADLVAPSRSRRWFPWSTTNASTNDENWTPAIAAAAPVKTAPATPPPQEKLGKNNQEKSGGSSESNKKKKKTGDFSKAGTKTPTPPPQEPEIPEYDCGHVALLQLCGGRPEGDRRTEARVEHQKSQLSYASTLSSIDEEGINKKEFKKLPRQILVLIPPGTLKSVSAEAVATNILKHSTSIGHVVFTGIQSMTSFKYEKFVERTPEVQELVTSLSLVDLPNLVKLECGPYFGKGMKRLKSATLKNLPKLFEIQQGLLGHTPSLTSVNLHQLPKLHRIGALFLHQSPELRYIALNNLPQLKEIQSSVFELCPKIKTCRITHLPELETIGSKFSSECPLLQHVDLQALPKLSTLDSRWLYKNIGVVEVTIAQLPALTSIGDDSLRGCTSLEKVTLEKLPQLRRIGQGFACNCTKIKKLVFRELPSVTGVPALLASIASRDKESLRSAAPGAEAVFGKDCSAELIEAVTRNLERRNKLVADKQALM